MLQDPTIIIIILKSVFDHSDLHLSSSPSCLVSSLSAAVSSVPSLGFSHRYKLIYHWWSGNKKTNKLNKKPKHQYEITLINLVVPLVALTIDWLSKKRNKAKKMRKSVSGTRTHSYVNSILRIALRAGPCKDFFFSLSLSLSLLYHLVFTLTCRFLSHVSGRKHDCHIIYDAAKFIIFSLLSIQ